MLFEEPLDYEFPDDPDYEYKDSNFSEEQIPWQYTVVPTHYKFKNITYEILDLLHLENDEDDLDSEKSLKKSLKELVGEKLWIKIENEAFKITNNHDYIEEIEEGPENEAELRRRKWYPDGIISYEDNTTSPSNVIRLQGVKVVVKRWFKWKRDITDANGYFRVGKFRSKKVKCGIKWERAKWDIRNGSYGQAWYNFETLRRGNSWVKTIWRSATPKNWLFASIHRGASEYFYNHNAYGIRHPYSRGIKIRRLHIGAKNKAGRAHYFNFNKIIWSAPVVIYASGKRSGPKNSRDLFATTIHELAHVSHWEIGYSTGQFVIDALADDPFLPESWATGVEYVITERVYPRAAFGIYDFDYQQQRTLRYIQTESKGYTPIVIDMIDNHNQSTTPRNNPDRPNDRVSGYTLGQLEAALPGSLGSWWNWRNRIREMYDNPTETRELGYLFNEYR